MATENQSEWNRVAAENKRKQRARCIDIAKQVFANDPRLQRYIDAVNAKPSPTKEQMYRPPVA
jgi:hypothetical protein